MSKKRFVKSVIEASKGSRTDLPWTRGATRQAMIAKRKVEKSLKRTA